MLQSPLPILGREAAVKGGLQGFATGRRQQLIRRGLIPDEPRWRDETLGQQLQQFGVRRCVVSHGSSPRRTRVFFPSEADLST